MIVRIGLKQYVPHRQIPDEKIDIYKVQDGQGATTLLEQDLFYRLYLCILEF